MRDEALEKMCACLKANLLKVFPVNFVNNRTKFSQLRWNFAVGTSKSGSAYYIAGFTCFFSFFVVFVVGRQHPEWLRYAHTVSVTDREIESGYRHCVSICFSTLFFIDSIWPFSTHSHDMQIADKFNIRTRCAWQYCESIEPFQWVTSLKR